VGAGVPCSKGERVDGKREVRGGEDNAVSSNLLVHLHKIF